ncbi:hypothetical protein ACWC9S_14540 [Streptomyces xiamenensis]
MRTTERLELPQVPMELLQLRETLALLGVSTTQVSLNPGLSPTISVHRMSLGIVRRLVPDLICGLARQHLSPGAVVWSAELKRAVVVVYTVGALIRVRAYDDASFETHAPAADLRPATVRQLAAVMPGESV